MISAAKVKAVHLRHLAIEQRQRRTVLPTSHRLLHGRQRRLTVFYGQYRLHPPIGEHPFRG